MQKTPIKWHGGKTYLADWIISHFPPHVHYVEPYAGGLSVLLRKPYKGTSEVVNDLDGELANFWFVLQNDDDYRSFKRIAEATPFSEYEFNCASSGTNTERVDRAVSFFIRCRQSRQGLQKDFATLSRNRTRRGMNEQVSAWLTAIEGLPAVHRRLKHVAILSRDALDVIRQQDGPNTLFYLDPPYLHETRVTTDDYNCEMNEKDHRELLELLDTIKGKFVLSGYSNPLYDSARKNHGWQKYSKQTTCNASSKKTKPVRWECIWTNF